ncbi:putative NAD-dependent epimerase dehydratase [Rosellinia necatrix]|uniref:Putative NAD-dependent epimerase dehydratase n=1 Tax=Rosellinia necatrix TaxID=77044 RepID=A0A1W2TKG0_ROSNE|nr:putative NAD-dependent epimerase dehydratase [Rosellinia necatrix]
MSSSSSYIQATASSARPPPKTVLVTGAAGCIGFAVSRAFARAGWAVYGLVRRASAADALRAEEVTPVVGAIGPDLGFVDALLRAAGRPFDVVVSCTEQMPFDDHWRDLLALLGRVGAHARALGAPRPLVLMSSGCKDYGVTARHGDAGLAPHTEDSPLDPPALVAGRARCALEALGHPDLFDGVVVRPTPLFGYGGSYYGVIFDALGQQLRKQQEEEEKKKSKDGAAEVTVIRVPGHADTIYHGCHVDDCADAYVALAAHADRAAVVRGRCYNVSAHRYETVGDILSALSGGAYEGLRIIASSPDEGEEIVDPTLRLLAPVLGYSQWVASDKIRALTGWSDRRPLFSEAPGLYRRAYEVAAGAGDAGVARIRDRVAGWVAEGIEFEGARSKAVGIGGE